VSDTTLARVTRVEPIIGMEVHVELATRTKMFTRAPSPAAPGVPEAGPNTLIDPVVLALPGALPVMNRAAVEMSMLVGAALGCRIAERSVWDRKSYFYPDLPKAYQISQYDLPLCFDGAIDVPAMDEAGWIDFDRPGTRVGIVRAHLEEDAGKLLHEAPGGRRIGHSIVDLNRAGTPLLEIVTAPDLRSAEEAAAFARLLHATCRFLRVTEGVMQKGHMRFEPNINCRLTLDDGSAVFTPIAEIKNLNSFRALLGAVRYEIGVQPARWAQTGEIHGPGMKSTRGWDDSREETFLQRSKEDALDYRYFPDPDLLPVVTSERRRAEVAASVPELPAARAGRYRDRLGRPDREAQTLAFDRASAELFDGAVALAAGRGVAAPEAAGLASNLILQCLARVAGERGTAIGALGMTPESLAGVVELRHAGSIGAGAAERLAEILLHEPGDARAIAEREGLLQVSDAAALGAWADEAIAELPAIAEQVRAGKLQAIGRLIGEVMKRSGGQADAKAVREILLTRLGG
jgi:aspartyl-tRNA(Asn)/glutamyl-tRNA(Gln) amidotransferase subunit B